MEDETLSLLWWNIIKKKRKIKNKQETTASQKETVIIKLYIITITTGISETPFHHNISTKGTISKVGENAIKH